MLRTYETAEEQRRLDGEQRLDDLCRRLLEIDADLVEWTLRPAHGGEKLIVAEFTVSDWRDPFWQIARRLRSIAIAVERLDPPPPGATRAKAA